MAPRSTVCRWRWLTCRAHTPPRPITSFPPFRIRVSRARSPISSAASVRTFIHVRGWIFYSVLGAARRAGVPVVASAHDHGQVCATKMLYQRRSVCSGPAFGKCVSCAHSYYGLKGIPLAAGLHEFGSAAPRRRPMDSYLVGARRPGSAPAGRHSPIRRSPRYRRRLLALASDERTAERPDSSRHGPYLFYAGALGQP